MLRSSLMRARESLSGTSRREEIDVSAFERRICPENQVQAIEEKRTQGCLSSIPRCREEAKVRRNLLMPGKARVLSNLSLQCRHSIDDIAIEKQNAVIDEHF
jgi:hypothetical protein